MGVEIQGFNADGSMDKNAQGGSVNVTGGSTQA